MFYQYGNPNILKKFDESYLFFSMYSEETISISLTVYFGLNEGSFLPITVDIFNKTKNHLIQKKNVFKNDANISEIKHQISKPLFYYKIN